MPIANLADLSSFLTRWYDVADLSVERASLLERDYAPATLINAWVSFGQLSVGYENWLKIGDPSPLACQDGFVAPGFLRAADGIVPIVIENQGNWVIGYRDGDQDPDPKMLSNVLEQEIGGTGFVEIGSVLSEVLATSVLTETIFFGALPTDEANSLEASCKHELWVGRYYNVVGHGPDYDVPSHRFRTNSDRSLVALDWDRKFSGFAAHRQIGRKRLHEFR